MRALGAPPEERRTLSTTSSGLALALVLTLVAWAQATEPWPSFLPPRVTFPPVIAAGVERVWRRPTITRRVEGEQAQAPFDLYVALIDAPEVTAAAARHLKLARYEARRLGDDWYQAEDGAGARGEYHVLVRERTRRVMFSHGSHRGRILGTITGAALTEIHFEPQGGHVVQGLTAWVLIENRFVAAMARLLVPLFGQVVDRKLQEAFRVTARVAEWAASRPGEFCQWLGQEPLPAEVRRPVGATVPGCRG